MAMVSDTPRHVGLGLQNRRVPVRFLSHLPLANLEFKRLPADELVSHFVVIKRN
jgi:hypothetical protein